jgi:hypothetical protein
MWFGGMPYYYANDVYYVCAPEPECLRGRTATRGCANEQFHCSRGVCYPRNGQTDAQQSEDRYQCHRWATEQTNFDPTRPAGGVAGNVEAARADDLRAMTACLRRPRLHGQIRLPLRWPSVACALLLLVGACTGGPRLAASPPTSVRLSGQWVIDVAASDDASALIRAALPKPKAQRKARYDLWGNEMRDGEDPGALPPGTTGRCSASGP